MPTVALYDTLGPDTSKFIINHAQVPIMASQLQNVASLLTIAPLCPSLKVIIAFNSFLPTNDQTVQVLKRWGASINVLVVTWYPFCRSIVANTISYG